ncbi:MAG TPA: SH3 domain-containing protein [Caldilineaceae bacterium]|nr:SH3 domain-containing protein [Caldilineaceae bacterium]
MQNILKITPSFLFLALLFLTPIPVSAIPFLGLNFNANPVYGTTEINVALDQPVSVNVDAGGPENINLFFKQDERCQGYTTNKPSYAIKINKKQLTLRIFAISKADTTLVIRTPNGKWYCNDDASGTNPIIDFASPSNGRYQIWIGDYQPNKSSRAFLVISNNKYSPSDYLGIDDADKQLAALTGIGGGGSAISLEAEVIAEQLNIRTGPGTNYSRVTTLSKGAIVTVLKQVNSCQWLNIRYRLLSGESRRGWISGSSQYVRINVSCNEIPASEANGNWSPLYLSNSCPRPIEVAIRYRTLSGEWLTDGWWQFEPKTANYLTNSGLQDVITNNAKFYFYARATDNSDTVWAGDVERQFQGTNLPMREIDITRDNLGDYTLNLTCDNAPDIHFYDFVCITNLTGRRIDYRFRWGNGQWQTLSVDPQQNRRHWWELKWDESSSPSFEIRFDADYTNAASNIGYWLPKKRTIDTACPNGQQYEFRFMGNNHIDLVRGN